MPGPGGQQALRVVPAPRDVPPALAVRVVAEQVALEVLAQNARLAFHAAGRTNPCLQRQRFAHIQRGCTAAIDKVVRTVELEAIAASSLNVMGPVNLPVIAIPACVAQDGAGAFVKIVACHQAGFRRPGGKAQPEAHDQYGELKGCLHVCGGIL